MHDPATLTDWRNLREFQIESGTEARVLKVGMMTAAPRVLAAAGMGPTYVIPERIRPIPTGVLPTITTEIVRGSELYRLPLELGEWVFELCTLARYGVKPLPASLRFDRIAGAIRVIPAVGNEARTLRPNTVEWLAALALQNAERALHTLAVVREAGSEDVCSICGDTSSSIFAYAEFAPVNSIRLCEKCYRSQSNSGARLTRPN